MSSSLPPAPSAEDTANSALIAVKTALGGSPRHEIQQAVTSSASLAQLIRHLRLIKDTELRAEAQEHLLTAAEKAASTLNDQMVDMMD